MQGQTPETVAKPKSSKLWIIICAVLLIGIVALAVTEVLAYQEISKRDDKITELEKKVDDGLTGELLSCYKGNKIYPEKK